MQHKLRYTLLIVSLLILLLVLSACGPVVRGPSKKKLYQTLKINTTDGWLIAASYYDSPSEKGLILMHMLAKNRHTFDDYAETLAADYKVLSIDFRGHGDSDGEYLDLTEADFKDMINDVEIAAWYLKEKQGVAEKDISLAGASIGANIALMYASKHPVDKLALISPGSRLRGIDIGRLNYPKPMFVQVAQYDAYSSISVDELELNWDKARVLKYNSAAHGTELLQYDLSAREDFMFYLT